MSDEIRERILLIVSGATGVPIESLDDDSGPDTVAEWDSLAQLNIVIAIQEELQVQLTDDDVLAMNDIGSIVKTVHERKA